MSNKKKRDLCFVCIYSRWLQLSLIYNQSSRWEGYELRCNSRVQSISSLLSFYLFDFFFFKRSPNRLDDRQRRVLKLLCLVGCCKKTSNCCDDCVYWCNTLCIHSLKIFFSTREKERGNIVKNKTRRRCCISLAIQQQREGYLLSIRAPQLIHYIVSLMYPFLPSRLSRNETSAFGRSLFFLLLLLLFFFFSKCVWRNRVSSKTSRYTTAQQAKETALTNQPFPLVVVYM